MNNIEEFKKELDALLTKYPDIGSFTIKVQPRITIDSTPDVRVYKPQVDAVKLTPASAEARNTPAPTDLITALEHRITPEKIAEMKKSITVE